MSSYTICSWVSGAQSLDFYAVFFVDYYMPYRSGAHEFKHNSW